MTSAAGGIVLTADLSVQDDRGGGGFEDRMRGGGIYGRVVLRYGD